MQRAASERTAWVRGAGPTGSLAALALAEAGWRVHLLDPQTPEQLLQRRRAYALTHSTQELLIQLKLWRHLSSCCHPFRRLELHDRGSKASTLFSAPEAVGWIADHRPLQQHLLEACHQHKAVTMHLGTGSTPSPSPDDLQVIAEGANSSSRDALGIGFRGFRYRQSCLTVQVKLTTTTSSSDDTAWELFRPEGPLAVLPFGAGVAQVVWSAPQQRCQQRCELHPEAFLAALNQALPPAAQAEALLDQPAWFPVEWRLAPRLGRGTTLLCGETAHRCHPVGGQGLNLCWRDVATLAALAQQPELGARQLVQRYGRRRWLDLIAVMIATDGLIRLFSNGHRLLLPIRRFGIALLDGIPALRRLSLNLATYGPAGMLLTGAWQRPNNQPP